MNVVLWIGTALAAVALLVLPFVGRYSERPVTLAILAMAAGTNLLLQVILRRGHVTLVSAINILEAWGVGILMVYETGTIRTPLTAFFVVAILLSAMVGTRRTIILATLLSIGAVLALTWAELEGYLPSVFDTSGTYVPVVTTGLMFIVVAALLLLVHHSIGESLARVQHNERELTSSNRELQAIRVSLEKQVAERTASAEAARQEAETARQAAEAQAWQTAGLVQLGDAMRGEQGLPTLAGQIIRHLGCYLDAPVGTLFVVQSGGLHLAGAHACSPAAAQFRPGEGLIGQVVRDGQPIVVHELPGDYLTITSGLGDMPPRHVVIWPLLYEGQALGAIELGLLDELTAAQQQFLEHAAGRAALALHTAQSRARIDELLAETQAQASKLALREEELSAMNEELQAQAESMRESRPPQGR